MRSCWIWWALTPKTLSLEEKEGEGDVKTEAEIGVMPLYA